MKWSAIAIGLLVISAPLSAQDQAQQQAQESEQEPIAVAQAKPNKKGKESDADDYKASEEISEDLSVSYPVDI